MRALTPWLRRPLPIQRREEEFPFYNLQQEVNRVFQDFFRAVEKEPWTALEESIGEYVPSVDMHETEKEITVSVELPGMEEKDVNVSLAGDVLTISGEKKSEKNENIKGHYRMERIYGIFRRSMALPAEVNADRIEATFKNGLLTITMPKAAEAQKNVKTISIKKS